MTWGSNGRNHTMDRLSTRAFLIISQMTHMLDRSEFAALVMAPMIARAVAISALGNGPTHSIAPAIRIPDGVFLNGLAREMEIAGVPGIAIGLVQERRLAWEHYQGVTDATTRQAVSADTMWPAASLSKPVVALAALRLVDEGRLDLDRPLRSYGRHGR